MYKLEDLKQKTLKELKEIGREIDVLPDGDRRCRRNWVEALAGFQFPEKSLDAEPVQEAIETSPGVEVEQALELIEVQATEPIASKLGRIVHPKPVKAPIAQAAKNSPGVESDPKPLTNADRWNPAEFGEVLHAAEPSGQLNLLEWDVSEPPKADDYDLMTDFHAACAIGGS